MPSIFSDLHISDLPRLAIAAISARSFSFENLSIAQWFRHLEVLAEHALSNYTQYDVHYTLKTLLPTILSAFQTRNPRPNDGILRQSLQPGGSPVQRPYPHKTVSDQDSGSHHQTEAHMTFPLAQRQDATMYPHYEENSAIPVPSIHAGWLYESNKNGW